MATHQARNQSAFILAWLDQLGCESLPPISSSTQISRKRKRTTDQSHTEFPARRSRYSHLASPPRSNSPDTKGPQSPIDSTQYSPTRMTHPMSQSSTPTRGKRRNPDEQQDEDVTPRQRPMRARKKSGMPSGDFPLLAHPRLPMTHGDMTGSLVTIYDSSASASDASSVTSASGQSATSSPTKEMVRMGLGPAAVISKSLSRETEDMPTKLLDMLSAMEDLEQAAGILPARLQEEIHLCKEQSRIPRIQAHMFDQTGARDMLGPTPSIEDILAIIDEAKHCHDTVQYEDAWVAAVQFPLLRLALHGNQTSGPGNLRPSQRFLDVRICSQAKIINRYRPVAAQRSKMVDLCVVGCPRNHVRDADVPSAVEAIQKLRTQLPDSSITHSDAPPLLDSPIFISVEVKRDGSGEQRQNLQIGTWQTAQWNMWSQLLEGRLKSRLSAHEKDQEDQLGESHGHHLENSDATERITQLEKHARCQAAELLSDLPYLPAVLIRGHSWSLAATSRDGDRTQLWTEYPIGTTKSILGAYKIVYGLQKLAQYAEDTIWPWYKRVILEVPRNE